MEITFWGVRGSYPVPGPATVRYGGQTSCVEVRAKSGAGVIIDAGTGLRALGQKLAREGGAGPRRYSILLSHVHWDHIQGLPFFEPAYVPDTVIDVYALLTAADELQQVIGGITRHEFFPIPLEAVPADFQFHEVDPGVAMTLGEFARRADGAQPPVRRGRLPDRGRRHVGGVRQRHRAVHRGAAQAALPVGARVADRRGSRGADADAGRAGGGAARLRHGHLRHPLRARGVRPLPALRALDAGPRARAPGRQRRPPPHPLPPRAVARRRPDGSDRRRVSSQAAPRSAST
jgi:hypothetical protein